jgi:hypothetical protein
MEVEDFFLGFLCAFSVMDKQRAVKFEQSKRRWGKGHCFKGGVCLRYTRSLSFVEGKRGPLEGNICLIHDVGTRVTVSEKRKRDSNWLDETRTGREQGNAAYV